MQAGATLLTGLLSIPVGESTLFQINPHLPSLIEDDILGHFNGAESPLSLTNFAKLICP